MGGNSKFLNLDDVRTTFMDAGYYRVDISPTLSILSLNTLYYSTDNDPVNQGKEGKDQLKWFEDQLESGED